MLFINLHCKWNFKTRKRGQYHCFVTIPTLQSFLLMQQLLLTGHFSELPDIDEKISFLPANWSTPVVFSFASPPLPVEGRQTTETRVNRGDISLAASNKRDYRAKWFWEEHPIVPNGPRRFCFSLRSRHLTNSSPWRF